MGCRFAHETTEKWKCGCPYTLAYITECRNPKRFNVPSLTYDRTGVYTVFADKDINKLKKMEESNKQIEFVCVRSFECSEAYCADYEAEDTSYLRKFSEYRKEIER